MRDTHLGKRPASGHNSGPPKPAMPSFIVAFLTSLLVTLVVIRSAALHAWSADHDFSGPQKFHTRAVPRIGGLGVLVAMVVAGVFANFAQTEGAPKFWLLVACGMPAFLLGIAEDLTKAVAARWRLFATCISAALAVWLLDAVILHTDIPGVDQLIVWFPAAIALTLLCVTGVANAVNIIDGFNGLASMCVLLMLLGIAYVAFQTGDAFVAGTAVIAAGAVLGFFVWNFPAGLIFLGDGGAYFIGFMLAELAIMLVMRNREVSAWYPVLLFMYPIFETCFSIYRKKFIRGMSPGIPDGVHLHMLVYKRLMRWAVGTKHAHDLTRRNSLTSPYLWLLCLVAVIPATLFWRHTVHLFVFVVLFALTYVWLYLSIVRFRAPRWMVVRKARRGH